jgi:hypothetical protein
MSSSSSSSPTPSSTGQYKKAFVKLDFLSNEEEVSVKVRVIVRKIDEDEDTQYEEEFYYNRDDKIDPSEIDNYLSDYFPIKSKQHYDAIRNVLEKMMKDSQCYEEYDIRILWDMEPDNEEPSETPFPLEGETKKAVDKLLSLSGVSYR